MKLHVTAGLHYLDANLFYSKLKYPFLWVTIFLRALLLQKVGGEKNFHYPGCVRSVKSECSASQNVTDRYFLWSYKHIFSQKWYSPTSRHISPSISWGSAAEQRWHTSTRHCFAVREEWRRGRRDPTQQIGHELDTAERLGKSPSDRALWSFSSLVTINPPQTNCNPICSNK